MIDYPVMYIPGNNEYYSDHDFEKKKVTAKYNDQLLTLSTCDYTKEDGRLVIVARKMNNCIH